jgi:hypothetical protein
MAYLTIFQGLMTPLIAVVAVYIAYQQWQTNRLKLVLDRYELRRKIYWRVREFLNLAVADFQPSPLEVTKFWIDIGDVHFLFGPEIPEYTTELGRRALESWRLHSEYRDSTQGPPPPDYDHVKLVKEMHAVETWLVGQGDVVLAKFRRYLDVSGERGPRGHFPFPLVPFR